jgi:hypothetical protein
VQPYEHQHSAVKWDAGEGFVPAWGRMMQFLQGEVPAAEKSAKLRLVAATASPSRILFFVSDQ